MREGRERPASTQGLLALRPLPGRVQHPENLNRVSANSINEKVAAVCQEFPRVWNPSGAANLRESCQGCGFLREDRIHLAGSANVVSLNKLECFTPIGSCGSGPNQIHHADLGNLLIASARRFVNSASTSSAEKTWPASASSTPICTWRRNHSSYWASVRCVSI